MKPWRKSLFKRVVSHILDIGNIVVRVVSTVIMFCNFSGHEQCRARDRTSSRDPPTVYTRAACRRYHEPCKLLLVDDSQNCAMEIR